MSFCPLVVSFYTKNTPYEKEAEGLAKSCEALGIAYCIEGVTLTDDWHTNTLYKPTFLKEQLQKHDQPLLWVDCDGRFRNMPALQCSSECDLAIYTNMDAPEDDWRRMRSSCFQISPTSGGMKFVDLWIERVSRGDIRYGDQEAMVSVINEHQAFKVESLPLGYVYISDLDPEPSELVVRHFQASRLYRKRSLSDQMTSFCSEWHSFAGHLSNHGASQGQLDSLKEMISNWNV